MPPAPCATRLEAAANRLGVRYRQLYVWDTRGNLATAMVTGLIPQLRQIVFTDLLLATLTEDEIEAVFGHEVGHVRHGHLLYYAAFLMLSFLTLGATYQWRRAVRPGSRGCTGTMAARPVGGGDVHVSVSGVRVRVAPVRAAGRRVRLQGSLVPGPGIAPVMSPDTSLVPPAVGPVPDRRRHVRQGPGTGGDDQRHGSRIR